MQYQFTPGAGRALAAAAKWTAREDCDELTAPALLLGLLAEPQCRAAIILARHGIDISAVRRRWGELTPCKAKTPSSGEQIPPERFSADLEFSLQTACRQLAEYPRPPVLAPEHLLLGLAAAGHEVSAWLREQGLEPDALGAEIRSGWLAADGHRSAALVGEAPEEQDWGTASLCPSHQPNPLPEGEGIQVHVLRVIDAAANRAREGLRVVEDYVRFVLDDRHLTGLCKQLRHDLAAVLGQVPTEHRLAARETQADVGTELATCSEQRRGDAAGVLAANFTRLQEALRSLEEFGKLLDTDMAAELKQLRYRTYTLGRAVEITRTSLERLGRARLHVLLDGRSSAEEFERLARSLIDAGVHVLQLRDKRLDDRRLLGRARLLHELTRRSDTLFIVNDRADVAALSRADGVHVGQEELSVKDARTIVGPRALVGVSIHSIEQARQAVLDGANYIGAGPVFPSGTKQFEQFPGVELLRAVSAEISLPAFAIGGIGRDNLAEVLAAGFTRIAVSRSITAAADPAVVVRELLAVLA